MGVTPGIRFFFHQIQGFPQFQLPFNSHVESLPGSEGKKWPANFHDHLQGQTEWQLMAWYRDVIGNWGKTWGMKFDTKYSCKMSQVTYTVTQSIVWAGALLTRTQKMFCLCLSHGKEISDIRFHFGEKMFSLFEPNTRADSKTSRWS